MAMGPDIEPAGTAATPEVAVVAAPGPPTREYRATVTFVVAAGFIVFILAVFSGYMSRLPPATSVVLGSLVVVAVDATEAYGLYLRRPWARFAMTPMLWIVLVLGLLSSLVALSRSTIEIPIGSILAIWAFNARPAEGLGRIPASSTEGTVLIVVAFAAALAQFITI
ncbi:MAG TPA: hypothetical protein VL749_05080 [Patescibacteria group bacterium]|nr:hypothetical protein [Patescibacteria group bacterium]